MKQVRMYLGRNIPGTNKGVTPEEFSIFLYSIVTPIFEGFTVYEATGFWKGQAENTSEVNSIASAYRKQFMQESVMVTLQEVDTSFI